MPLRKKRKKKQFPRLRDFGMKLGGLLASKGIAAWMQTLDTRAVYYDRSVDPISGVGGPRIYVFWHEYILLPLALRGNCHLSMLLSQHGDADILARIANHFGFGCVRGSTFRGGARALWELEDRSRTQHLTITPDGPRGPRRQLAQGPIYLASRLQIPIVAMGFGYDRPWRMNSWDRFGVPRIFSRARAVVGPPVMVPENLDREQLETCRLRTERLLNCLTAEAEAWAAAGSRKAGEIVVRRQFAPRPMAQPRAVPALPALVPSRAA
jgi:lysophospholipid acyltransferase (LPLAT)-like uncharacterized protein